jgi:hypothetical protein
MSGQTIDPSLYRSATGARAPRARCGQRQARTRRARLGARRRGRRDRLDGGTSAAIAEAGLPVTQVAASPATRDLDGRVRTLHPPCTPGSSPTSASSTTSASSPSSRSSPTSS